jgi:hypothetical protein
MTWGARRQNCGPPWGTVGASLCTPRFNNNAAFHGPQCKSRGSALKTANELVMEIGVAVQPPRGVAIVLTEEPGALPNWVAAAGIMDAGMGVDCHTTPSASPSPP